LACRLPRKEQLIAMLVDRARGAGLRLTGEGGLGFAEFLGFCKGRAREMSFRNCC
jgi:hypothetical protein